MGIRIEFGERKIWGRNNNNIPTCISLSVYLRVEFIQKKSQAGNASIICQVEIGLKAKKIFQPYY